MTEDNKDKKASSMTDKVVTGVTVIGAIIIGRIVGFLGIGAIAVGWFIYDRTKENLGRFMAVCAGSVSGLAIYGFAVFAIIG